MSTELTREIIETAFDGVGRLAAARGIVVGIAVYGGSCLIVVIEVMSPGTRSRDERLKHSFYWYMPTIRHIVVVDTERRTVQHDVRTEDGYDRSVLTDPEAVIDLTAIGFSIALEKVYAGASPT